ncbi:gasdermin-D isoform X2 [Oryctolagus cuniculus]|uniref:gasdermin-D isoform X2 n=1 Tax=Oryctolagus cuniculus TaxID=9986 RepID=UPI003879A38A
MPSAFKSVVRSVLRELDSGGQLTPVDSLHSSTSFRPYCLLGRKPSRSLFWKSRCGVQRLLRLRRCRGCTGAGQRGAGRPRAGEDRGRGCGLRQQQQLHESVQAASGHEHLGGHGPRQQLRRRGDNVYVVTEALQTQQEVQVTQARKQEGSGQFTLSGAVHLQGKGQGHLSRKKMVTIPAGSVLAFGVAQLVIGSDWDILLLPEKKWKTFQPLPPGDKPRSSSYSLVPHSGFEADAPAEWPVLTEDFQGLRAEVEAKLLELECWDRRLSRKLLGGLAPLLRDHQALGALESLLEQGLGREEPQPQDGPARAVFECLPRASGALVMEVANPIFYLVGALTVLSGTQQELLARALETGALVGQLELVGSFLEQSVPWEERSTVPLPPTLLGSSWGEDAAAWTLLEECGHEPQAGAPEVCWEPQAQGPTCALYASLALLARLSQ